MVLKIIYVYSNHFINGAFLIFCAFYCMLNPLHSKGKLSCQFNQSVHSCLEIAILIRMSTNNPSQKSVWQPRLGLTEDSRPTDPWCTIDWSARGYTLSSVCCVMEVWWKIGGLMMDDHTCGLKVFSSIKGWWSIIPTNRCQTPFLYFQLQISANWIK